MARLEHYIPVGGKRLRCGYTTGTCAAAAAAGAAELLLTGRQLSAVRIETPAGIPVEAELLDLRAGPDWASCTVQKDGGDDPDVTDGTMICVRAEKTDSGIVIDGGPGVGRITQPGLDQPVGAAAINSVPRQMIRSQVEKVMAAAGYAGGVRIMVSAPDGEKLASGTFNPRLGIRGGISILGTSGIVRPMSEAALVESVRLELDMLAAAGRRDIVLTPGNYGEEFARAGLGLHEGQRATCSNYLGEAIDHAVGLGFRSVLLVGHIGKLVKVAAGNFNTHSRVSDGRREVLTAHAALCGAGVSLLQELFQCVTTDAALDLLNREGFMETVMESVTRALEENLKHRAGAMEMEAVCFSRKFGILGKTSGADRLLARMREVETI